MKLIQISTLLVLILSSAVFTVTISSKSALRATKQNSFLEVSAENLQKNEPQQGGQGGPGAGGPGAQGAGAQGAGAQGAGAQGAGAQGAGGPGAGGPGAGGPGAGGPGAGGPGAGGPGAQGPGAGGPGAQGPGAQGPGAQGPGAQGPGQGEHKGVETSNKTYSSQTTTSFAKTSASGLPVSENNSQNISAMANGPGDNSIQVDLQKVEISIDRKILGVKTISPSPKTTTCKHSVGYTYIITDRDNNRHELQFYDDYCYSKKKSQSNNSNGGGSQPVTYEFKYKNNDKVKGSILVFEFPTENDAKHFIMEELKTKGIFDCEGAKGGKQGGENGGNKGGNK